MGEAEVVPVLVDIATGLQDLHSIGIIHRDLKPANVLRHAGRWKLADFGIARDQEIGTQDPTFAGWGSFPYMAPELWELKSPAVKTDLYALGCLGYELLAGAPPYTGDQAAVRAGHLAQAPPEAPCGDVVLKSLIGRLIAKRPEDRPQDARAVLDRLRRALVARGPVQESIARPWSPCCRAGPRRRRPVGGPGRRGCAPPAGRPSQGRPARDRQRRAQRPAGR